MSIALIWSSLPIRVMEGFSMVGLSTTTRFPIELQWEGENIYKNDKQYFK